MKFIMWISVLVFVLTEAEDLEGYLEGNDPLDCLSLQQYKVLP